MVLVLITLTFVADTPPNVTLAPAAKFAPEIVTSVPPFVPPELGDTLLTTGAGLGLGDKVP